MIVLVYSKARQLASAAQPPLPAASAPWCTRATDCRVASLKRSTRHCSPPAAQLPAMCEAGCAVTITCNDEIRLRFAVAKTNAVEACGLIACQLREL